MKISAVSIGDKLGHLAVVAVHGQNSRGNSYLCRCDCGKEVILRRAHLLDRPGRPGNKSCGCAHDRQLGLASRNLRLYYAWKSMVSRCYDPYTTSYKRYGAKGVIVCDEWRNDSSGFAQWALSHGYADNLELDRIDYTKGYSPENCRWVDQYIQAQNKGLNRNSTTGIKGVSRYADSGRYRAYIMRFGIKMNLGIFDTIEEATAARTEAEQRYTDRESLGLAAT